MSPETVLEVRDLVKEIPLASRRRRGARRDSVKAVSGVTFQLAAGETFGLVGESGSGKTTLARVILALEPATSGQVLVQGVDLAALDPRPRRLARRAIQPVFQDAFASLDPRMQVSPIVAEPLVVQRVGSPAERRLRVEELLDEVGLSRETRTRHPHQLSGGQRQRVALARALALSPSLVVADEPVSALDVSVRAQILNLMSDLKRSRHLSYLFISHDLSVVGHVADRIAVMYLGKLMEQGPAPAVYSRPAHPYTAGLIGSIPRPYPPDRHAPRNRPPIGEMPSAIDPPSGCRYRTRCPRAQTLCAEVEPRLAPTAEGDHLVACHFPL